MQTIYTIPAPDSMNAQIEVYGEPENGMYEWRIIDDGHVVHDTFDCQYGQAEIALRDALMYASGLDINIDTSHAAKSSSSPSP